MTFGQAQTLNTFTTWIGFGKYPSSTKFSCTFEMTPSLLLDFLNETNVCQKMVMTEDRNWSLDPSTYFLRDIINMDSDKVKNNNDFVDGEDDPKDQRKRKTTICCLSEDKMKNGNSKKWIYFRFAALFFIFLIVLCIIYGFKSNMVKKHGDE